MDNPGRWRSAGPFPGNPSSPDQEPVRPADSRPHSSQRSSLRRLCTPPPAWQRPPALNRHGQLPPAYLLRPDPAFLNPRGEIRGRLECPCHLRKCASPKTVVRLAIEVEDVHAFRPRSGPYLPFDSVRSRAATRQPGLPARVAHGRARGPATQFAPKVQTMICRRPNHPARSDMEMPSGVARRCRPASPATRGRPF